QAHIGVEICALGTGHSLYEKNGCHLFIPASVTKLVMAAVALDVLGVDYQFETTFVADGHIEKGKLVGNLYLKGAGDPSLTDKHIEKMVQQLVQKGIQQITGTV